MADQELTLRFRVDGNDIIAVDQIGNKIKKLDDNVQKADTSFGALSAAIKGSIVVTGIESAISVVGRLKGAIDSVLSALSEGESLRTLDAAFERLAFRAGTTGEAITEALMKSTQGKVDDDELKKYMLVMEDLGITGTQAMDAISGAFGIANRTGKELGEVWTKVESAIATGNPRSIARLGVFVDKNVELEKAARAAGVAVKDLTKEQEREILQTAIVAQVSGKQAKSYENMSIGAKAAQVQIAELGDTFKTWLAGGAVGALDQTPYAEIFRDAKSAAEQVSTYGKAAIDAANKVSVAEDKLYVLELRKAQIVDSNKLRTRQMGDDPREARVNQQIREVKAELAKLQEAGDVSLDALRKSYQDLSLKAEDAINVIIKKEKEWYSWAAQGQAQEKVTMLQEQLKNLESAITSLESVDATKFSGEIDALRNKADMARKGLDGLETALRSISEVKADLPMAKERLRYLEATGQTASETAVRLRAAIPEFEKTNKVIIEMGNSIKGLSLPAEISEAYAMMPMRSYEDIQSLASAIKEVHEAQENWNKAVKSEDIDEAQLALIQLEGATKMLNRRMQELNVNGEAVSNTFVRLSRDLSQAKAATEALATGQSFIGQWLSDVGDKASQVAAGLGQFVDMVRAIPLDEDKPKTGGGGTRDISESELMMRRLIADETDEQMKIELEYALAHERISTASLGRREREAQLYEILTKRNQDLLRLAEQRRQTEEDILRRAVELSQELAQQAMDVATDAIANALDGLKDIDAAMLDARVAAGELTQEQRAYIEARAAMDEATDPWQLEAARIRLATSELELHRAEQKRLGETISSVAESFGLAASNMESLAGGLGGQELSRGAKTTMANMANLGKAIGGMVGNLKGTGPELAASAAGVASAGAQIVAGMSGSMSGAAKIMAAMSAANALFLAFWNPAAAAQQAAAAVSYGLVAALAGKSGSGATPVSTAQALSRSASAAPSSQSTNVYNFYVQGAILADRKRMGAELQGWIDSARRSGAR